MSQYLLHMVKVDMWASSDPLPNHAKRVETPKKGNCRQFCYLTLRGSDHHLINRCNRSAANSNFLQKRRRPAWEACPIMQAGQFFSQLCYQNTFRNTAFAGTCPQQLPQMVHT